jgi:membrane fusion protein (multidrug efflux system)
MTGNRMQYARIVALLAASASACNGARNDAAASAAPSASTPAATPTVDVVPVVLKPLDTTMQLEGELEPYERVAIFARANGFVSQVLVDRGSHVKQGQLLVTIVAPELGAQRAEAQGSFMATRARSTG